MEGQTTIDPVEKLRLEDLFSIENAIFQFKLKSIYSAPEQARTI
jgi:hypothetical protein